MNKGAPSPPKLQICISMGSINETLNHSDAPKRPKASIEEVEDADEVRMKLKVKMGGPGILEHVDQCQEQTQPQSRSTANEVRAKELENVPSGKTE